jgi:hypothetical protein
VGAKAGEHAGEVVGPVVGDQLNREPGGRRLVENGRYDGGGTVADEAVPLDRRRSRRLQHDIRPAVDHLPAGGLDLRAESVGAWPVASGAGL